MQEFRPLIQQSLTVLMSQ